MHKGTGMAAALILAASAGSAAVQGSTGQRKATAFPQIAVAPFRVEPQPHPGAPERPDEAAILRLLAEEAGRRAERTLLQQHLAGQVVRVSSPEDARGLPLVTGTVRLPVSLPPGQAGGRAMFRNGPFAAATVTLRAAGLAREESVTLAWGDVRWVGGGRSRRVRKVDDVLADFTRKAVDRAVKRLKKPLPTEGGR